MHSCPILYFEILITIVDSAVNKIQDILCNTVSFKLSTIAACERLLDDIVATLGKGQTFTICVNIKLLIMPNINHQYSGVMTQSRNKSQRCWNSKSLESCPQLHKYGEAHISYVMCLSTSILVI